MTGAIEPLLAPAREALRQGDAARALTLLDALPASGPTTLPVQLDRALALRLLGRLPEAVDALDAVLAIEPYHLLAMLSKGALVERMGQGKAAARIYANALAFAPPPERLPGSLAAQLDHARQVVREDGAKLRAALEAAAAGLDLTARETRRFEEAADIAAGLKTPFHHEPLLLNFPQLPAVPFHDETLFPWLAELEAATDVIAAEYLTAIEELAGAFAPYVEYPKGAPVNQWGELNHSRRWSAMFLWKDGARQDGACEQCPRTAALLDRLPLARQPGFAPTVVFSVLDARTHIPPHTGSTNARALVHLPLVLPGPARFRVGHETRDWKMGQAWVFDDTIEHEAWNDAGTPRTIMILDVWNPYLSDAERSLASAMLAARKEYYRG